MALDLSAHTEMVLHPDPVLRRYAQPVLLDPGERLALAEHLKQMLLKHEGAGLAAPQLGLSLRVFAMHVQASRSSSVQVFFNPAIVGRGGRQVLQGEGCLSLPGVCIPVWRYRRIAAIVQDAEGRSQTVNATDMDARVFQHEFDHLDGKLIIDRAGKRERTRKRGG